jgi:biotin synthase-like enzyme
LLLRVTRNCPWNQCTFCGMYKDEKFSLRAVADVKKDIDSIAAIGRGLGSISREPGFHGRIDRRVVLRWMEAEPEFSRHPGFVMAANWYISGGRTAFLQDANSLQMKSDHLVEILKYLRASFPGLQRVTTYARAKTIARKEPGELKAIREAGLDRLHVGLETGDDELLKKIKKGVTSREHILAGKKALDAGFQLSEYWMPGLGGKERWREHAVNTARVLNEINPHYARSRPFFPFPGTPIHEEFQRGQFPYLSIEEQLQELKLMVENLHFSSRLCFDHDGNHWTDGSGRRLFRLDYEGYPFPKEKETVLQLIHTGLRHARANRMPV